MPFRRFAALAGIVVLFSTAALAQRSTGRYRPGTGDTTAYVVPWRYLEPGVAPATEPLVVDWFPASRQEIERSQLLRSRVLSDYASQCIGLQVILPEDKQRIAKFDVADRRPVVLLAEADGKVVRRIEPVHGTLRVADVEKALEDELNARGTIVVQQLSEARTKSATDRTAAVDLYSKVWAQRCLFPFAAHEAERALRQLGVKVEPAAADHSVPQQKTKTE